MKCGKRTERIVQLCRDISKTHTTTQMAKYCSEVTGEVISRAQVWYALNSRGVFTTDDENELLIIHKNNMLTKSWDKDLNIERT